MTNPNRIQADLAEFRDGRCQNLFRALGLAIELLGDVAWVNAHDGGGGDESRALDRLEAHYFADVCGPDLSLSQLLDVRRHFPDVYVWEENKNNTRKMYALWKAKTQPPKPVSPKTRPTPGGLPDPIEFSQLPPATARHAYERATKQVTKKDAEIARLREENAALKAENQMLRERIRAYETGDQRLAGAAG